MPWKRMLAYITSSVNETCCTESSTRLNFPPLLSFVDDEKRTRGTVVMHLA